MKASVVPFTNLVNETRSTSQSTTQRPATNQDDIIVRIERLAKLKADVILTDEEFQQQKHRILNG
jgi:hypothetical protein